MRNLYIDLETYSSVDISAGGLHKYVAAPDFQILLFAYAIDDYPVKVIDLASGEAPPDWLIKAVQDKGEKYIKYAYNAAFEQACLNKVYGSPISGWRCVMLHGAYCGYPLGLAAIGEALGLAEDKKKLSIGNSLIRLFCVPKKPAKTAQSTLWGHSPRVLPEHEPEKWRLFKEYCARDVETEIAVEKALSLIEVPASEQKGWELDCEINSRGVAIDAELAQNAVRIDEATTAALIGEAQKLTGLDNPSSPTQLSAWLSAKLKRNIPDLTKETVGKLLKTVEDAAARRVLEIRQETSKTSVKKYTAMLNAEYGGRVRGLLQFYGAPRTGRWAGRLVQVQNLPRNYLPSLDAARKLAKQGNGEAISLIYGNVADCLSQLIRTAFIPSPGNVFLVADYSAIEARVISWLANENWRLDVFKSGGDIYCASAANMFGVPVEKHGVNSHLRQKGKIAELALGYQGGIGALAAMGAKDMGLTDNELQDIVTRWRAANPKIVELWRRVEDAAKYAINVRACASVGLSSECYPNTKLPRSLIDFDVKRVANVRSLQICLPSGRCLYYASPQIENGHITYMGQNQTTRKWQKLETYGGKLTENIVQATARDILAEALLRLAAAGYKPVMHIHDEIVIDHPCGGFLTPEQELERVVAVMCDTPKWAKGLPLNAEGFISEYYKKD